MIWESSYWKRDLLKLADQLTAKTTQSRFTERSMVNLEKQIFIGFYSIRKLIEAKKLSDAVANLPMPAVSFPCRGEAVTLMNWHRVDDLYDFAAENPESLQLPFVCNQLIHSFVFILSFDEEDKPESVLFSSERKRNEKLYRLGMSEIIRVLKLVGSDYPNRMRMVYDERKRDFLCTLETVPSTAGD